MKTPFKVILKEVTCFLNENLPKHLTYHNTAHTIYVLDRSIHIAKKEKINDKELQLIKIAALYHDIGFTVSHIEHEIESCKIARKQLKKYQYSNTDIEIICGMIMATKIPQNPQNHLEQILADADLEYLATSRFQSVSELLYIELKYFNNDLTRDQWVQLQIDFISKHQYHTKYCKHYKTYRKLENLVLLKQVT